MLNLWTDKVLASPQTSKHLKGSPISLASLSRNLTTPSDEQCMVIMYVKRINSLSPKKMEPTIVRLRPRGVQTLERYSPDAQQLSEASHCRVFTRVVEHA